MKGLPTQKGVPVVNSEYGCKVVAFYGTESYDLIHYLTRVLKALGKRCLVADRTENGEMLLSVPVVDKNEFTDYQGVCFTTGQVDLKTVDVDYVFMYYRYNFTRIPTSIEEAYFVTDCQMQSVRGLKKASLGQYQFRALIVRNSLVQRNVMEYLKMELEHLEFLEENTYMLSFNTGDLEAMLSTQYDGMFRFNSISSEVKDFIISFCSVDFDEKDVVKALRDTMKAGGK